MGVCLSNVKAIDEESLFMVGKGIQENPNSKALLKDYWKWQLHRIDLKRLSPDLVLESYNKRLAGSSDMSFLTVGELRIFKQCTGGDSIFAEFKGQNGFELSTKDSSGSV